MQAQTVAYSGRFGGAKTGVGDFLCTTIQCANQPVSITDKQIIFVVDESGSMAPSLDSLKVSLLAMRDAMLENFPEVTSKPQDKDEVMNTLNMALIGFSDYAHILWRSDECKSKSDRKAEHSTFTQAVQGLKAAGATNLGHALKCAFDLKRPQSVTWIVVLTDGMPNTGDYRSVDDFKRFMPTTPEHTKIISLGYGTQWNPEILNVLGSMTYIDDQERIAGIFGSIAGEIVTCFGFDAKIMVPSHPALTQHDLFGSTNFGCVYNDRKFMFARLLANASARAFLNSPIYIEYYDIVSKQITTLRHIVSSVSTDIPYDVCAAYFAASKARMVTAFFSAHDVELEKTRKLITSKIADWEHPSAAEHKADLEHLIQTPQNQHERLSYVTAAGATASQSDYVSAKYATPVQRRTADNANTSYIRLTQQSQQAQSQ